MRVLLRYWRLLSGWVDERMLVLARRRYARHTASWLPDPPPQRVEAFLERLWSDVSRVVDARLGVLPDPGMNGVPLRAQARRALAEARCDPGEPIVDDPYPPYPWESSEA